MVKKLQFIYRHKHRGFHKYLKIINKKIHVGILKRDSLMYDNLNRFLSDREWVPILSEAHTHYGAGKAEVVAKVWYLSCVMQYPLYGCTLFPATYRGYWSYGN